MQISQLYINRLKELKKKRKEIFAYNYDLSEKIEEKRKEITSLKNQAYEIVHNDNTPTEELYTRTNEYIDKIENLVYQIDSDLKKMNENKKSFNKELKIIKDQIIDKYNLSEEDTEKEINKIINENQ